MWGSKSTDPVTSLAQIWDCEDVMPEISYFRVQDWTENVRSDSNPMMRFFPMDHAAGNRATSLLGPSSVIGLTEPPVRSGSVSQIRQREQKPPMSAHSLEALVEKHSLARDGSVVSFAAGRNVVLQTCDDEVFEQRDRDSAHANSHVLCEYKWENKTTYDGRILTARDKLIAYRLFNDTTGEAIRVLERESRARHLIKDFRFSTVDLLWAQHAPLLAVLDSNTNLYVYHVNEDTNELSKYLNIIRPESKETSGATPHLVWCPFVEDPEKATQIIAIFKGKHVDIFFLHLIKKTLSLLEISFDSLKDVPNGHISIDTESEISAVRISPDATACAITTVDGNLTFYILDGGVAKHTHQIQPLSNLYVNEILFLDNLTSKKRDPQLEPFWKYVILVSDNGRRLGIYSCYNWDCIAKLRFESAIQANRLEVIIDPTARFVYLADYDSSNLFCIELAPAFPSIEPYFVSCAQICFSSQLVCLTPCALEENVGEQEELLFEDDGDRRKTVNITFAAITNRSLLEVCVDLERSLDVDLNISPDKGAKLIQEKLAQQSKQLMLSSQRLPNSATTANEQDVGASASPRSRRSADTKGRRSGGGGRHIAAGGDDDDGYSVQDEEEGLILQEIRKSRQLLAQLFEKNEQCEARLGEMNIQLEKVHKDNADLRREQTDNLADVLEKISNEIRTRDENIEQTIGRMNGSLRVDVQRIVEQTLNDNAVSLQSTMEVSNTRVVETVKNVITQILVPAVDGLCNQLFHQLNETFRDGLQEFVEQLKHTQSQAVTPLIPDFTTLSQMIDNNQIGQAFDWVLSRQDLSGLLYLCNKVNPDVLFNDSQTQLSPGIILGLLQTLGQRFEQDTDLKFNYLENIVMSLNNVVSPTLSEVFRATLDQISKQLHAFGSKEANVKYKRQVRIITQLIISATKY